MDGGNRFIDMASFNPLMTELADYILQQKTFTNNLHHRLQRHRSQVIGPQMQIYVSDLYSHLNALSQWLNSLQKLFIHAEEHKLFFLADIPCEPSISFGPFIQKQLTDDPYINTDLCYFGLVHNATRYLQTLSDEPGLIRELKTAAASKVIHLAKAAMASVPHISIDVINQHVAKRLSTIARLNSTPTDFTLKLGVNSIRVHRLVLFRFAQEMQTFFERALSGTWKESEQASLELSDTIMWPTVVEFISWLYGISSIEQVPRFLTKRFTEAANFFMCGAPLTNKLEQFIK